MYSIEGTKCLHKEQSRGAYKNKTFWPTFQEDINNFKEKLLEHRKKHSPFSLLRIGHSEFSLFNTIVPDKGKIGNLRGRHSNGKEKKKDHIYYYESLLNTDYITTQIGYDFKDWLNTLHNYKNQYIHYKTENKLDELLANPLLLTNNNQEYSIKQVIDMPLDIIYGLVANKWFFKTFKNKIGLIGSEHKINVIKVLMKRQEYREYLGTDCFTDYISIPQRAALNDPNLEANLEKALKASTCDIFLCGMGVSKLRIFYRIKDIRNCIYIDVGCGICAIAGMVDIRRPYMGLWKNYRLKGYDYSKVEQIDWDYGLKKTDNNQVFIE